MDFNFDPLAWTGHSLSTLAILGSLAGIFPGVAALAAFVWYCICIYQSATVQLWLKTRRLRKIASLKKKLATIEARERAEVHKIEVQDH